MSNDQKSDDGTNSDQEVNDDNSNGGKGLSEEDREAAALAAQERFFELDVEMKSTMVELKKRGSDMDEVCEEFEKLYRSFINVHNSELRYSKRAKELTNEIRTARGKRLDLKSEDDRVQNHKGHLKDVIAQTWKSSNEAKIQEQDKKNKISALKVSIERLKNDLSRGSGWTKEQELAINKLRAEQKDLEEQLEERAQLLTTIRDSIGSLGGNLADEEKLRQSLQSDNLELDSLINAVTKEGEEERRNKAEQDSKLNEVKSKIEATAIDIDASRRQIRTGRLELAQKDSQLAKTKRSLETFLKRYEAIVLDTSHLTEDVDEQVKASKKIEESHKVLDTAINEKKFEHNLTRKELAKIKKIIAIAKKRVEYFVKMKEKADAAREEILSLKQKITDDLMNEKMNCEKIKKQISELSREKDILSKDLSGSEDRASKLSAVIKLQHNTGRNLQVEEAGHVVHGRLQHEQIETIESDIEKYDRAHSEANKMYYAALDWVKREDRNIVELQMNIAEGATRLKQQQNLYEQVRADRNTYSKNLIEHQNEILEMRRKFKMMNHQIEQLKEEITGKDHSLVKEHFEHHKVEREKDVLKNAVTKAKKRTVNCRQISSQQASEISKLNSILQEAEAERDRQAKEISSITSEQQLLGSQLTQRNQELRQLYEKIKLLRARLTTGEKYYDKICNQTNEYYKTIDTLKTELENAKGNVTELDELKRAALNIESELTREKIKKTFLSAELGRPINVHRWRKLEGSDPARWIQVQRLQELQTQVIDKTSEVMNIDILIQEKEVLYVELKNVLGRQPGPEVKEQLEIYEYNLKQKNKQMKAMRGELKLYQEQVKQHKRDIEHIREKKDGLKSSYFNTMRDRANNAYARVMTGGNSGDGKRVAGDESVGAMGGSEKVTEEFSGDQKMEEQKTES
jgi:chromosome segregation ATPase